MFTEKYRKMEKQRVKMLNEKEIKDETYVLYWMQQAQRARYNHALTYAIEQAKELNKPLIVCFGLMGNYPEANARHYTFMLEGLQEVQEDLASRDIKFILRYGHPTEVVKTLAQKAALVVCDRGYLKHQRKWRKDLAKDLEVKLVQIETDVIVPVEVASEKEEYAARTIRKKIMTQLDTFKDLPKEPRVSKQSLTLSLTGEDISDIPKVLKKLNVNKNPAAVSGYLKGGTNEAKKRFKRWLENSYAVYDENRNQPATDDVSMMSAYLHFGQISAHWLLEQLKNRRGENREAYTEELVVRRELAINFVYYNDAYDSLKAIPDWAAETLETHKSDKREKVYTKDELENAETADAYWNAAMNTMKATGYLHNHMRMYWGKQILIYTNTPQYAHKVVLELNNKYFLDGRDANSYANIAWLFGNHDRGWTERDVFGKVRSMTKGGLERKIDTDAFLEKTKKLMDKFK